MDDSDFASELKRLNLPPYDNDEERDYFPRLSLDEYFDLAYKFFKANGKSEVEVKKEIDKIRKEREKLIKFLKSSPENFQRVMLLYFTFNMQIYAGKRTVEVTEATEGANSEDKEAVFKSDFPRRDVDYAGVRKMLKATSWKVGNISK